MSRLSKVALLTAISFIALTGCALDDSRESAQLNPSASSSSNPAPDSAVESPSAATTPPAATATPSAKATTKPVAAGLSSVNVKLLTFKGTTIDGAAYQSQQLVAGPSVLWFYTPWCAICRNEGAAMASLIEKYDGKINFVAIGASGSAAEMQEFAQTTKTAGITHLDDANLSLWNRFGVVIQPSHVFVSASGKVETNVGPIDHDVLAKKISALTK